MNKFVKFHDSTPYSTVQVIASDLHVQSDHARTYNVFSDVQADQFQYVCQDKPFCTKFSVSFDILYSVYWVRIDFLLTIKE